LNFLKTWVSLYFQTLFISWLLWHAICSHWFWVDGEELLVKKKKTLKSMNIKNLMDNLWIWKMMIYNVVTYKIMINNVVIYFFRVKFNLIFWLLCRAICSQWFRVDGEEQPILTLKNSLHFSHSWLPRFINCLSSD